MHAQSKSELKLKHSSQKKKKKEFKEDDMEFEMTSSQGFDDYATDELFNDLKV